MLKKILHCETEGVLCKIVRIERMGNLAPRTVGKRIREANRRTAARWSGQISVKFAGHVSGRYSRTYDYMQVPALLTKSIFFFKQLKSIFTRGWVDDPSSFRCLIKSDFCMWIKRPHVKLDFRM
jgi:hypothetical protein